jgi:predicted nuclease of predicted toxin-antitoxin system
MAIEAVIISKDEDFARRRGIVSSGPVIVWLRIRNTSRRSLLRRFASLFPGVLAALQHGETLIEVR